MGVAPAPSTTTSSTTTGSASASGSAVATASALQGDDDSAGAWRTIADDMNSDGRTDVMQVGSTSVVVFTSQLTGVPAGELPPSAITAIPSS